MKKLDVLCFGEALVDLFPTRPGIALSACRTFVRHLGGAPANVSVGLARKGARAGISTLVGPDAFGDYVLGALQEEGVDTAYIGRHATAKTGVAFVAVGLDGQRSFLFFRHPSADMAVGPEHVTRESIASTHLLHFGSSTLAREPSRQATLRATELAHELSVPLSMDPNLRAHLWDDLDLARSLLQPLLARAAMVKISDDELEPLLGVAGVEEGARILRALGCGVAIVTLGGKGAYFDSPSGHGFVAAPEVAVVDTTGAGDAFVAGFWSALLEPLRGGFLPAALGRDAIALAVGAGCRLGAEAVTELGATEGLSRRQTQPVVADPRPWARGEERELLSTRIFRVVGRTLTSPRTGLTREYSLIECPDWCNVVALTDDGHVVMIKQVRHGSDEITLELPGGMIDPEDADPLRGCVRELREETGYEGTAARLIGATSPNPAMQSNRCHTALVEHAQLVGEKQQDDGEDIEVVLVPYREIPGRIARGEITHALVVVAFTHALGLVPP